MTETSADKGVIFDKDGTLFDFQRLWTSAARLFVERLAEMPDGDKLVVQQQLGTVNGQIQANSPLASGTMQEIAQVLVQQKVFAELVSAQQLVDQFFEDYLRNHLDELEPVGPVTQLLEQLKAEGFIIGVVTSDNLVPTQLSLEYSGLLPYISFIGSGDCYPSKPDASVLRAFCRETRLKPKDVLVVGDSLVDVELGLKARTGIAVLSGTSSAADFAGRTPWIYPTIHDIPFLAFYDSLNE